MLGLAGDDVNLDVLAQPQRAFIPKGHLDAQDSRIGGPAGVVGKRVASDDGKGDLFNLALPALIAVTFSRDCCFRRRGDARNIVFIDLGLDPEPGEIDDRHEGRAGCDRLAGVDQARDDDAVDRRGNAIPGRLGLELCDGFPGGIAVRDGDRLFFRAHVGRGRLGIGRGRREAEPIRACIRRRPISASFKRKRASRNEAFTWSARSSMSKSPFLTAFCSAAGKRTIVPSTSLPTVTSAPG